MNAQAINYNDKVIPISIYNNVDKNNNENTSVTEKVMIQQVKAPILDEEYKKNKIEKPVHEKVRPIPKDYLPMIKEYFYRPSRYKSMNLRNYAYFILEINIARRAGDALRLKVSDILNEDETFKTHIIFNEEKTGKRAVVYFNSKAKEAMAEYLNTKEEYSMSDLLFVNYRTGEGITVDGMRKVIKRMAKALDIDINLATHSLRKTFITEAIRNNPNDSNIEIMASMILNHSDIKATRHYICQTQDEMDRFYEDNAL